MIRLTRRYRFSASHRLHTPELSDSENEELYGKCNNPYGHGHDYVLDITVAGPVDAATGQVARIPNLDRLVANQIVGQFDHKNLNLDVPEFTNLVPTSENVTLVIERRLLEKWGSEFSGEWPRLERVRLQETKRNGFELRT
jgi:6-pyruvoyltetrahydropterin/6-carboxytetrahydropterin synthase